MPGVLAMLETMVRQLGQFTFFVQRSEDSIASSIVPVIPG